MVIVWNCCAGQMFGFNDVEEYKGWIAKNTDNYSGFDNTVYEVESGEECTEDKEVYLHEWNCNVLHPIGKN